MGHAVPRLSNGTTSKCTNFTKYPSSGIGTSSLCRQCIAKLHSPGKSSCYNRSVVLDIIKYGHPVLREKGKRIEQVSAQIRRAERVTVRARSLDNKEISFECTGLLARAAQHEVDHLNGILFVDRMDAATRASLAGKLKKMQKETVSGLAKPKRSRSLVRL